MMKENIVFTLIKHKTYKKYDKFIIYKTSLLSNPADKKNVIPFLSKGGIPLKDDRRFSILEKLFLYSL